MSLALANYSDRLAQRRSLLLFCLLALMCNALLFAFCRDYLWLLIGASLLSAIGSAAVPQLFALARQTRSDNQFSAILRAQFSLAWIFGPPLAFWMVQRHGFTALYASSTALLIGVCLLTFALPKGIAPPPSQAQTQPQPVDRNLIYLILATLLVWSGSALYLIAFPIHLAQQPGLSSNWTGILYGVAAALEIPIMLISARSLPRWGKKRQMQFAILCGMVFYAAIYFSSSFIALLLQIFNAIFIAVIATVGLFWFQELLHSRQGLAATLYTNAVTLGVLIAGVLQGVLTSLLPLAIWPAACLLLLVMSLLLITKVNHV